MKCYNCGRTLSEKNFCTACGADVTLYKKIMYISNMYYNDGLEKANVRDLSGAVTSLRQCLKFNKNHIEARNLLGLVYFERGQVAAALSEWVISKNFRPDKNIADDYISVVQNNATRQDTLKQTIKKYNIALEYCRQDSLDLAVIQLKKVLSLNPKFVEAHQLLALLYIKNEEWEKAYRELLKCVRIDTNNTTTLSYLKEVNLMLDGEEKSSSSHTSGYTVPHRRKGVAEDAITYQSGNETIIQPVNTRDSALAGTVLNIVIGLIIGIAVSCFLILPARIRSQENDYIEQLREVSENSDAKTATISELEQKLGKLEEENESYRQQVEELTGANGEGNATDSLFEVVSLYMADAHERDKEALQEALLSIDEEYVETEASAAYKEVYQLILDGVGKELADELVQAGNLALNQNDYTTAIENFEKAWRLEKEDGQILYQLAQAYRLSEDDEKAKETYEQVVELFPDSNYARNAQEYLDEL
ncbi:MAG: tetratricopeptide repeat protein [Lachnospiraceae bacterium]|nr:tetratricopeptide repeat protein [Lachnospiraceae bacterium]